MFGLAREEREGAVRACLEVCTLRTVLTVYIYIYMGFTVCKFKHTSAAQTTN